VGKNAKELDSNAYLKLGYDKSKVGVVVDRTWKE
jgi:hypothetical protein